MTAVAFMYGFNHCKPATRQQRNYEIQYETRRCSHPCRKETQEYRGQKKRRLDHVQIQNREEHDKSELYSGPWTRIENTNAVLVGTMIEHDASERLRHELVDFDNEREAHKELQ
jgi:hypothetical protein